MDVFWPVLIGGVSGIAVATALILVVNCVIKRKLNTHENSGNLDSVVNSRPSTGMVQLGRGLRTRAA